MDRFRGYPTSSASLTMFPCFQETFVLSWPVPARHCTSFDSTPVWLSMVHVTISLVPLYLFVGPAQRAFNFELVCLELLSILWSFPLSPSVSSSNLFLRLFFTSLDSHLLCFSFCDVVLMYCCVVLIRNWVILVFWTVVCFLCFRFAVFSW